MGESISPSDVFNELAYEFAERLRHGEHPSLTEYTERYPDLATEIRDLFPTLAIVEQIGSADSHTADRLANGRKREDSIPERLGDFRIIREIGRGGMGIVYEAEQESLGRHVALKVLTQHRLVGPIQLMRFQREARSVALLHHTNIVPVFGVGAADGTHYYAMQYIHGRSLDSVLRELVRVRSRSVAENTDLHDAPGNVSVSLARGLLTNRFLAQPALADASAIDATQFTPPGSSLALAQQTADEESPLVTGFSSSSSIFSRKENHYYRSVARLGMQAAEALAHAHAHGVIHRDIKPANLLLDLQGTIWVTDFGLAKAEGAEELTSPGDVVGTLRYMAPERFQGESDEQCDIYGLGVSLYEMLTLKPAFSASYRPQLIKSIIETEPLRPRKLDAQIPRDLETIVLKAIAKRSADRFLSAAEMARELGRVVGRQPIRSRRVTPPERLWRWSRRNPAVAMLTLLAIFLTTVLALTSTTAAWKYRDQRDAVRKEQRNTQAELGHSLLLQCRALRYSRQPGRRTEGLETIAKAASIARNVMAPSDLTEKLRDEAIATLAEVDERQLRIWKGLKLSSENSSFAFDVDRYIAVENDGCLHIRRFCDRSEIQVAKSDDFSALTWPILIPGGRFVIACSGPTQVKLWDVERRELPAAWPVDVRCAVYRPDGKQVAALRSDGEIRVFDLPAMTEAARWNIGLDAPSRLAYGKMALSQNGLLAFIRQDTQDVEIHEVASGRIVLDLKAPLARVRKRLAVSRNGGLLAVCHDRAISVFDVSNGEPLAMLQGHQSEGINAYFQPEGNLLASECWDGTTRIWDPIRGHLLVSLRGTFRGWVGSESQFLIDRDQDLILYQIAPGAERKIVDCRILSQNAGDALYGPARVAFSPDGQMIAMALRPEGVRIVRSADGANLARLPIGDCDEVLYLPDGSLLTCNDRGLCRWPVRQSQAGTMTMGPPAPLTQINPREGYVHLGLASNESGRLIGVGEPTQLGSVLLNPKKPWQRTWLVPHRLVSDLAISPDGRWAASNGLEPSRDNRLVKVWDVVTGRLQIELPAEDSHAVFSPDSQWLAVKVGSRYRLFRTGSWSSGSEIDCGLNHAAARIAFHPSAKLAAVVDASNSVVRLADLNTGRVLASFESPDESQIYCIVFSPDGRFLAASRSDQRVELWDLSSIRRRLEELNLATGIPDVFSGGATVSACPSVDRIELESADPAGLRLLALRQALREITFGIRQMLGLSPTDATELYKRAGRWELLGQWRLAVTDYRASLAQCPDSAIAANKLAWRLIFMPDRSGTLEALRWARTAVDLMPDDPRFRNTLAAALYRAGRFAECASELERNIARHTETSGFDGVFLAMCRQQLGQAEAARRALARAAQWRSPTMSTTSIHFLEFQSLLAEAYGLVYKYLPDVPADVFDR